jgi:regulator of protease activity HflC (stomatin/prohibitin superfamily)
MKNLLFLLFPLFVLSSCYRVTPNGDEESVLLMKPLMFGHGGVDETPVSSGSEWVASTTDYVTFKITPVTLAEKFDDMMTDDNTPVDFSAYLRIQVKKGQTPILYKNFGENWYENNIAPTFRAQVRDKAASYKMFDLTSNREILASIETDLFNKIADHIHKMNMPITVLQVTVGAVTPPAEVLEETRRTAAQNQSKLTQEARANAELARKQAEINKAIADQSYQRQMNMSTGDYLKLRNLEIEKEKIELIRDKQNVSIIFGSSVQPTYDVK